MLFGAKSWSAACRVCLDKAYDALGVLVSCHHGDRFRAGGCWSAASGFRGAGSSCSAPLSVSVGYGKFSIIAKGANMVRKRAENGTYYHEPPYTEEEEFDLYRRFGGAKSLSIAQPPASMRHPQKSPPAQEEK